MCFPEFGFCLLSDNSIQLWLVMAGGCFFIGTVTVKFVLGGIHHDNSFLGYLLLLFFFMLFCSFCFGALRQSRLMHFSWAWFGSGLICFISFCFCVLFKASKSPISFFSAFCLCFWFWYFYFSCFVTRILFLLPYHQSRVYYIISVFLLCYVGYVLCLLKLHHSCFILGYLLLLLCFITRFLACYVFLV